jgi:arylsulfatase A-like enzyme
VKADLRKYWLLAAAVAMAVVMAAVWAVSREAGEAPSVFLITVDTLRPDHLGCYGYARATSPSIDAFAREAALFEDCYSQAPTTRPSVATILTGFYPHECRVITNSDNLPQLLPTMAERLKEAGYTTLAVSSNFVLGPNSGFNQGFDVFDNRLEELEAVRRVPERTAEKTTDAVLNLLRENRGRKLFLWVHYQDPHGPYTPPRPFDTTFMDQTRKPRLLTLNRDLSGKGGIPYYQQIGENRDAGFYEARYDGEIAYLDTHLARLIEALKQMGFYDNSLIILTADHGEGMGEHDYYFAHGEYVYNSLIRVPLIIRWRAACSGRSQDPVGLVDIMPTVLEVAGLEPEPGLRGRSILARGGGPRSIFSEMSGKFSMIGDGLKMIYHGDEGELMLFDLRNDPGEEHNLITDARLSKAAKSLAAQMDEAREADHFGTNLESAPANLSDEDKAKLRSLGYIQ